VISLLSEALARQHHAQSTVRACNTNAAIAELLKGALHGPDEHLELHASAEGLWDELDEYGGDLLVVGFDGPVLSGPELCRMVRAHTRWHRLPIVIVGDDHPSHLAEAMASGADDYVSADISSLELEIWLHTALRDRRIADTRSDVDPVTGTENRVALDRSLDRVFRRSMQDGEPFSLALVGIDQFEQMRSTEGSAVGDGALRRLGTRLTSSVPDGSAVGRWSDSTFAVGIYGALSQDAAGWIDGAIRALSAEGIPTTSGTLSHCTYSAGITSAPIDGSSFPSLERMCETALLRATAGEDSVVISGNRPGEGSEHVVDVVLVEDDDSVADVIEHALGLHQYGFLRFSDGAEAASALGDGRVKARVVLLDVGLPSLDGFGVLNVLRSKGLLGATRVIMLTARSSEAEMLRALGLGAMEHITKPFSIPVLLGRLDQTRASAML
jgi:diguanylate cyclase (GGDEF)-like protein